MQLVGMSDYCVEDAELSLQSLTEIFNRLVTHQDQIAIKQANSCKQLRREVEGDFRSALEI